MMRWEPKWRQQKAVDEGSTADQVSNTSQLCCRAFPPLLRELIASLQLAAGWASAETQSPRVHEPHIPHRLCVHGPPACPVKPTVYSLPAGLGANSGGGRFVQHYHDNGAIWGTEGTQARLFTAQQTPQHIMCGHGHLRVTVFCITSDEKGKVISSPFKAIIGRT